MDTNEPAPRTRIPLNGTWDLHPSNDADMPESWGHSVQVPALVDAAVPGYDWAAFRYHWYRTRFRAEQKSDLAFIVIEQAMFGTDVWLNGERLGGDIACYTSQEYDAGAALRPGEINELTVRVGRREDLPPASAAGKDQERRTWVPGIWGDVYLTCCGNPRIRLVQVVPHIGTGVAEVRLWLENRSADEFSADVAARVLEKRSGDPASEFALRRVTLRAGEERCVTFEAGIRAATLWTPEHPFLYELDAYVLDRQTILDRVLTTFGMREFTIAGPDFLLNGRKIRLRGGNIAFHRFLSDPGRGLLPWKKEWVTRLLVDLPKAHGFNFFRFHLGHAYNRWYDIADERGMLLQDEWMFWTTSGTKEQISREFTRWLEDNWNHPSIVIWDALNESRDPVVEREIVPAMKRIDPTRPWGPVDFTEQHPYIYSLGPVLVNRKFGFSEALDAIERSAAPSVVNEFLWWWLDSGFNPTALTREVIERWLGRRWTKEELVARQAFLAQELIELFRRMDVRAIQPFVYLSDDAGPTAHWFTGDIAELHPKPVLDAVRNAFAPFGVSLELWDRHFFTNETKSIRVYLFNDGPRPAKGTLRTGIRREDGSWHARTELQAALAPGERRVEEVAFVFPTAPGTYRVSAELVASDGEVTAMSRKIAHVLAPPEPEPTLRRERIALLGARGDAAAYLESLGIEMVDVLSAGESERDRCRILLVEAGGARDADFRSAVSRVDAFLQSGKTLIVIEPEFGVTKREEVPLTGSAGVTIEPRADTERGGYDSYLFAESPGHSLWKGIPKEHLCMFNGGYGGEIVSEHSVEASLPSTVHASCGLGLKIPALFEMRAGGGRIIVSRLQLRGRLMPSAGGGSLYGRRPDPVLQRFLLNLLAYASHDD